MIIGILVVVSGVSALAIKFSTEDEKQILMEVNNGRKQVAMS